MTVLVVEDYLNFLFDIENRLTEDGVEVLSAKNLAEARGFIAARLQDIEIIVWDANLPDGTSFQLIRETRARFSGPMIAGGGDQDDRSAQMRAGCDYEEIIIPAKIQALVKKMLAKIQK